MENSNIRQMNDVKMCSELVLQEADLSVMTSESASTIQGVNNSHLYTDLESGSEVIAIVEDENTEEIFIYEKNENQENSSENSNGYIQVFDASNALSENSHEAERVTVNISGEDNATEKIDKVKAENENVKEETIIVNVTEAQVCLPTNNKVLEEEHVKNFKNVILEDWDVDTSQIIGNCEVGNTIQIIEIQEGISKESAIEREVSENSLPENSSNNAVELVNAKEKKENSFNCLTKDQNLGKNVSQESVISDPKIESLKVPKSITKNEIVKILDETADRAVRPIPTGKDLFFSIELTKRLNQKLSQGRSKNSESESKSNENDSCNNNNTLDERQKIVDILEADEVKDWKSVPTKSIPDKKENGNDMEISKAIKKMEEENSNENASVKVQKKPGKKFRALDKELERTIALQQLREEFPSTRKRSRTSKKMNHIPFLASTVLEKALTSPEVTTALKPGPPKRRPCYLPENVSSGKSVVNVNVDNKKEEKIQEKGVNAKEKMNEETLEDTNTKMNDLELNPDNCCKVLAKPIVKTYSVKRKSTDTENDIKSTIAAVRKALSESTEGARNSKPKKQKTVIKPDNLKKNKTMVKDKKVKGASGGERKRNLELEKLLGDEGAVRMLYDTQHKEPGSAPPKKHKFKTTTGLRKDLVLKKKLVKNAVMRLSGVGFEGVSLRGKRHLVKPKPENLNVEEPLFSSTPNIVLYKPKKKQRAEASRILYRHSSSESFDSSEGYRRASFEVDGLNSVGNAEPIFNGSKQEQSISTQMEEGTTRSKKSEILAKRKYKKGPKHKNVILKRFKVPKEKKQVENKNSELPAARGPKLNLSCVPVRKSSRPRTVSRKYSIWSSTSMDSLSVESLGLKKLKKGSTELGKKLNVKEVTIMQFDHLVQIVLAPTSKLLKNSLSSAVLLELIQVFHQLDEEDSCKVVLLSSQGSTFCQGVDINQIISFDDSERKNGVPQLIKAVREFIMCLAEFRKPIIVGVQAAAVGLGVTLLPYCDLVISSDKAFFYTPYLKIGQAPEGAPTHTFPRIHRHLVSELLYKNQKMTATDALKYGLITEVIPESRFEEDLMMIARSVAARPTQGTQSLRFLLKRVELKEVEEVLQAEGKLLLEHWTSPDCINSMVNFLNSGELQLKPLEKT